MAVDTTQSWQEHTSDGSTAYFSFNFNYDTTRPGTIIVGKRTADNTYSVVNASDYELIPNASGDGGQIRFIQNPSGSQVIDDIPASGTIIRIERVSVDTSSATWQIGLEMSELVNLFDRLFRLVQENKGGFDNVIKTFETQHDVSLYEMLATHDNRLFFWDNTNKTITPTDFPKEDVVRCVNGLFFRVSVNQSGIKYLEWSENGSSDWKGIDISSVNALAQDAHDIATQANNAINTHIADTNNPHSVTKAQVGLGNVDNTSDANKPISTATQTALNAKQDTISDLATIRTGASKGATAVQPGDLATVATSGSYNDLSNKPTIGDGTITIKQSGTIKGTFTTNQTGNTEIDLDAGGTGTVFSVNGQTGTVVLTASDVGAATSAQGTKADTAVQPGDLATVATTGDYDDLTNKPTIPAAQVNSDWSANSGVAQILNKPTLGTMASESASDYTPTSGLATVATTGAYSDLTGKPTIPDAVQFSTMPTASVDYLGRIVEFTGTTDANYTNGYFYKCVSDGQTPATYSWTQTDVQPNAGGLPSQTGNSGKFLTTDGTNASWGQIVNSGFAVKNASVSNTYMSVELDSTVNVGRIGFFAAGNYRCGFNFLKYSSNNQLRLNLNGTSGGFFFESTGIYWYGFNNCSLGKSDAKWITTYTTKINNGSDIAVPNTSGTMVVANYTGATQGDVLTLDSNLNPVWQSADYVVEFQAPTAQNNYTWYRKYKSGWVEQGGIATNTSTADRWASAQVSFPIEMADTNYVALGTAYGMDSVSTILCCIGGIDSNNQDNGTSKTTTGMVLQGERMYSGGPARITKWQWQVSGMAQG